MGYEVLVSSATHDDIERAVGYVAITLASPAAAASLLDEYEYALKLISGNPYIFGLDLYVSEALNRQIRRCPVKKYAVYYLIDDENRKVFVIGFMHGLQDSASLLGVRVN